MHRQILLYLSLLLTSLLAQQMTSLTQPPYIETNVFTITGLNASSPTIKTTFTYIVPFDTDPLVFFSLVNLQSLQPLSTTTLRQRLLGVTNSNCDHQLEISMKVGSTKYNFHKLDVLYLAFDPATYPFIMPHQLDLAVPGITLNEFVKVDYLSRPTSIFIPYRPALDPNCTYSLESMLSGFKNLVLSGQPALYIDTVPYNNDSYLVNIKRTNVAVEIVDVLRVLIDQTTMYAMATNYTDLVCSAGTIVHVADPLAIQNNPDPAFLPFAILYGIKGWIGTTFDLPALTYIFNNSNPRVEVNIGYVLFQTQICPSNQLYVEVQNLCYGLSASFYYQLTPETMAPCPTTCYTCIGPLSTNCKSCVQGWNRYLLAGRCQCLPGFYDPGAPICKNCTEAISGCKTCSSSTNCLTCLPGCTAIGFSPIYCDCPGHVQSNYSYNCPQHYYFQHDTQQCQCLPQTYLDTTTSLCFPCQIGCYICVNSPDYCLTCIDSYTLIGHSCIFYFSSYALMGQGNSLNSPWARCLRWKGDVCLQTCSKYYVGFNCYGACPKGTFNISFPWLTCQPCKLSCSYCYNFTVCFQCKKQYFYFNSSTFACNRCSPHCLTCLNNSHCSSCQTGYNMVNHACQSTALALPSCFGNCLYCLVGSQCLVCSDGFYLSTSDYMCYDCRNRLGFFYEFGRGCKQVCGDGIVVQDQCDDGNSKDGDGCSGVCKIEEGYRCWQQGRSYCWSYNVPIQWHIYSIIGKNKFTLQISSTQQQLSSVLTSLTCVFDSAPLCTKIDIIHAYTVSYSQPLTLPKSMTHSDRTKTHVRDVNAINRCTLTVNKLFEYEIAVDAVPELLLVDWQNGWQDWVSSQNARVAMRVLVCLSVALGVLGLVPPSGYVYLRVNVLLLVAFLDYYSIPLNALPVYQSLQSLLFVPPSPTTKQLVTYSNSFHFTLLWRSCLAYLTALLLQHFFLPLLHRLLSHLQRKSLAKIAKHIVDNKNTTLQQLSVVYDVLGYWLVLKTIENAQQVDYKVALMTAIQITFILVGKIHLFYTDPIKQQQTSYLRHAIITDLVLNPTAAGAVVLSTRTVSYSPVVLALFAVYSIAAVALARPAKVDPQFKITAAMAAFQYGISLLFLFTVHSLKCANSWRSFTSTDQYQPSSISFGLAISLLCFGTILANSIVTLIALCIRLCQIFQPPPQQQLEQATIQNSVEGWSVSQS